MNVMNVMKVKNGNVLIKEAKRERVKFLLSTNHYERKIHEDILYIFQSLEG